MQRVCVMLKVRPDRMEEFVERHRSVWPDMLHALKDSGWNNYSSFLAPDGTFIGYVEVEDFASAQAALASTEANARWQASMEGFFEGLEDARPDESMKPLPMIFQLEEQLAALPPV